MQHIFIVSLCQHYSIGPALAEGLIGGNMSDYNPNTKNANRNTSLSYK
jgi:hypothetical protein